METNNNTDDKIKKQRYWFGNPVSQYGMEYGYVNYHCLAKAFEGVLANDLRKMTDGVIGYWEIENGDIEYYVDSSGNRYSYDEKEKIVEELETKREILDNLLLNKDNDEEKNNRISKRIKEIDEEIDTLENADTDYYDIYQEFIIDACGARILKDYTNEIVFYNEKLDLYIWGVTHYGTSWDYVLTDIKLD